MRLNIIRGMILASIMLAASVHAGFDEGGAAFQARDYTKVFKQFKPLAECGDDRPQHIPGMM
jgi:hypothetical protein